MFPSQKLGHHPPENRLIRCFNEAGMFPSQKCAERGVRPGFRTRFNEAGMFPSQKSPSAVLQGMAGHASMRPGCFHPRNAVISRPSVNKMKLQ